MRRTVLLTRTDLHVQHQPQIADPISMQHVARAPRLVRVVADFRTFLSSIQRLDARVDVEYPRLLQRIAHAVHQRRAQPRRTRRLINA